MNLLDIFEGREPYQQAIDKLEQRRIEDLEARMDDCARRGDKEGFQKCKAERDSYYKVKTNEGSMKHLMHKDAERMSREQFCSKYGDEHGEFWDNINGPLDEAGIGQDIADKKEKIARATPQTKAGAVASTVKNAAKWLAGKGGPGKEGPTYEGKDDAWSKESEWKKVPKAKSGKPVDPRGEVTHLSDVARREAERKVAQKKNSETLDELSPATLKSYADKRGSQVAALKADNPDAAPGSKDWVKAAVPAQKVGRAKQKIARAERQQGVDEGWSDAIVAQRTGRPRTPYSVYINGKKWKDFENDDHAENVANKLRAKFEREGKDPSVITIAPTDYNKDIKEAGGPAQQAAIAIAKKKEQGVTEDTGSWIVYDPKTKQIKKRFKTHTAGKSYAQTHGLGFASSEYYFDNIKQTVAEFAPSGGDDGEPDEEGILRKLAAQWWHGDEDPRAEKALASMGWSIGQNESDDEDGVFVVRIGDINGDSFISFPEDELTLEENLKKWFKEKWVRFGPNGKIRGDCARGSESEGKPKCLPQSKAHALGKKGRASSAAKKRREDPNPERRGPAKNVATKVKEDDLDENCWKGYHKEGNKELFGKTVPNCVKNESVQGIPFNQCPKCGGKIVHESQLAEKQDACYHKVKSRYKVWPSAYASGALVQCRKKGAANWGNKSKNESAEQELDEKWSQKYKSSINCSNPKGFSQKAHCAGKKKNEGMFSTLEENNEARDAVESAIIRRIMVAHKDLLMKFGPQKVMSAAEAVADEHTDVEEIGTSDVSAYVHEVERYLAMNN